MRGKAAGARGHWPYASQVFALPPHRIRGGAPVSRRLRDGSRHPPILRDVAKRDGVEASSMETDDLALHCSGSHSGAS